jgi:uncharacterized protein
LSMAQCLKTTVGCHSMDSFRKLTVEDKPVLDRNIDFLQPETSDLTFTNLFMWQNSYGLQVFYHQSLDYWFLWCKPPKWINFFLPPIGDWSDPEKVKEALHFMEEWAETSNFPFLLRRTPKRLVNALQKADPTLKIKEDRHTFDYLYLSSDLINLAGRKFHGKRNHLNQFLRKYQWEYLQLDPKLAQECLNLETEWFDLQKKSDSEVSEEEQAMAALLSHFELLEVTGGVIKIDGKIEALAVGEELNTNTAVIHIEKANTEYEGMFTAINQQFAANCWADYEFINREEDMGLEGLRKAKLSYNPIQVLEKYSVSRK